MRGFVKSKPPGNGKIAYYGACHNDFGVNAKKSSGKHLVPRSWMNVVEARELPLECRQLRGSEQHLRSPGLHLPDLLSQIEIVFVLNQWCTH